MDQSEIDSFLLQDQNRDHPGVGGSIERDNLDGDNSSRGNSPPKEDHTEDGAASTMM